MRVKSILFILLLLLVTGCMSQDVPEDNKSYVRWYGVVITDAQELYVEYMGLNNAYMEGERSNRWKIDMSQNLQNIYNLGTIIIDRPNVPKEHEQSYLILEKAAEDMQIFAVTAAEGYNTNNQAKINQAEVVLGQARSGVVQSVEVFDMELENE